MEKLKLEFFFLFLIWFFNTAYSQNKQGNTSGSELFADAPVRLKRYTTDGNASPLPVHFYIHDSQCTGCNNELSYIDIKIKNAVDTNFTTLLTFEGLTDSAFISLFSDSSVTDIAFDMQSFWQGKPRPSAEHTIIFTADTNWWIPPVSIVDITHRYFYFTLNIPGSALESLSDIIDVEVKFGIDYETDQYSYLRIFRTNNAHPSIENWYRGDTHYHSLFTQNTAEVGFPLEAVKHVAKLAGLDWITITDHSCDYDNYGLSMQDNWLKEGVWADSLNLNDTSFVFIRGIEMSVKNSADNTVHALVYPNPEKTDSLPYLGDGGGDIFSTDVTVEMLFDSIAKYDATCFSAHPFAEEDIISSMVDGGIWNVNDSLFPENGMPHPSIGTVICNDLTLLSDIYNEDTLFLFQSGLYGGELWNLNNAVITYDNTDNPWNVFHDDGADTFVEFFDSEPLNCFYRLTQGFDVYGMLLKRGLIKKNRNNLIQNWKYFTIAGSDAHGSFNYANTDMFAGISGNINGNTIGSLSTLVFCPVGMGNHGQNVLKALRAGHAVMSSGPIIIANLTSMDTLLALPGDDIDLSSVNMTDVDFNLQIATNNDYGDVSKIIIYGGTETGETSIEIQDSSYSGSLYDIMQQIWGANLPKNQYFYIRAELFTTKYYNGDTYLYKQESEIFRSYTNPIWIKSGVLVGEKQSYNAGIAVYPNPCTNSLFITGDKIYNSRIQIFSIDGKEVNILPKYFTNRAEINTRSLLKGAYYLTIQSENAVSRVIFIKN